MRDLSVQKAGRKRDWSLTEGALRGLLGWLDEGVDSGGQKYLEMRRRLVAYFDRKNCPAPDELADETLNRVARRLEEEGGSIETDAPARYCYTLARHVFMEHLRAARKSDALADELRRQPTGGDTAAPEAGDESEIREETLNCLEKCLAGLEAPNREIIARYYSGSERAKMGSRRALAEELGITANALRIRACRLRDRLEECVRRCVG